MTTTTTVSPRVVRPLHCSGWYFIYKMIFLCCYNGMLSILVDGYTYYNYKLLTGCLVPSLVKWYLWRPNGYRDVLYWLYTCIADAGGFWLGLWYCPRYLQGWNYGWSTIIGLAWEVPVEYGQYYLFHRHTDTYTIRLTKNALADGAVPLLIAASFGILGWYVDLVSHTRWSMVSWYTPLLCVMIMTAQDAWNGAFHWCLHAYPQLWKRHQMHHEYIRSELNAFASFYNDWLDSLFTASGFYITLLLCICCGGATHQIMIDCGVAASSSHGKYQPSRRALTYFWEYDCLDLLFNRIRVSEYHNRHHKNLERCYGLFGFISDTSFKTYVPQIVQAANIQIKDTHTTMK